MHHINDIPVKYSFRVVKVIKDNHGIDLISNQNIEAVQRWIENFNNQESLFWQMIKEGYRQEQKPCPYSLGEMESLLNDHLQQFIAVYQEDGLKILTPKSKY